jgi:hypothetical protein
MEVDRKIVCLSCTCETNVVSEMIFRKLNYYVLFILSLFLHELYYYCYNSSHFSLFVCQTFELLTFSDWFKWTLNIYISEDTRLRDASPLTKHLKLLAKTMSLSYTFKFLFPCPFIILYTFAVQKIYSVLSIRLLKCIFMTYGS